MEYFSPLQTQLLQLLGDGYCHDANTLSQGLNLSPISLQTLIQELTEWGLSFQCASLQTYQLSKPFQLLDEQYIRQQLINKGFPKTFNFNYFASIDSTNQFLKDMSANPELSICCAEKQTHGRGRFGRQWISPFGENIYCSSRWELHCDCSSLSSLSLVVGLAILASLKATAITTKLCLKWPNDILWGEKKLCGILIEVNHEAHRSQVGNAMTEVIIGIGINVNTPTQLQLLTDKPWCSLYEITGHLFNRNPLIVNLIYYLEQYLAKFLRKGFAAFHTEWQQADCLQNKLITVSQAQGLIMGQSLGVNELGQLCLKDKNGKMHYLSSGEASLHE